jgi:DNA repair exonuclease SbcCD nuclease subunit
MRFSFVHAADLHIDSPLVGLKLKDAAVAERFANAGRRAVEALLAETIASKAAFLIIAGDVFDGSWKDVTTGLFFVSAIARLHREGIPTFIVKGNHDADSVVSLDLPYPKSVMVPIRQGGQPRARCVSRRAARPQLPEPSHRRIRLDVSGAPRRLAQYRRAAHLTRRQAGSRRLCTMQRG